MGVVLADVLVSVYLAHRFTCAWLVFEIAVVRVYELLQVVTYRC